MLSFSENRFYYLLIALLLMILINPLVKDSLILSIAFDVSTSMIFILGCLTLSDKKIVPWVAVALSVPMLLSIWLGFFGFEVLHLTVAGKVSGILYFLLVAWVLLAHVYRAKEVTWQVISAALIVYLTLGVIWGFAYALVDLLQPGSFRFAVELADPSKGYMYFSFITLATVGYGDITPVTGVAGSLAMLEGIIGQFYMTVLVARLVGMHVATAGISSDNRMNSS